MSYLFGVHCLSQDTGAPMVPVIYDAIRTHYLINASSEADLIIGFVPLPRWPPPSDAFARPKFMQKLCAHLDQTVKRLAKLVGVRDVDSIPDSEYLDEMEKLRNVFVLTPLVPGLNNITRNRGLNNVCRSFGFKRANELTLIFDADKPDATFRPPADNPRVHKVPIPYMSNIRWSERLVQDPPWVRSLARGRTALMSFVGSVGDPGTPRYAARSAMMRGCIAAGPSMCEVIDFTSGNGCEGIPEYLGEHDVKSFRCIRRVFRLKARSIFCLEPPGNSPGRKSIIDSLLSGCVPVFLQDEHMAAHFDQYLPWHFGWRRNASVSYSAQKLVSGSLSFETIVTDLAQMNSTGGVRALQQTIAKNAHNLVYGIRGHYRDDDAIGLMLRGLVEWTRSTYGYKS